jgi:hypothetical protein
MAVGLAGPPAPASVNLARLVATIPLFLLSFLHPIPHDDAPVLEDASSFFGRSVPMWCLCKIWCPTTSVIIILQAAHEPFCTANPIIIPLLIGP